MPTKKKKLSPKHQKFADRYLVLMNGTRAYMDVYPKASYATAGVNSSKLLLENTDIQHYINTKLKKYQMSADEAIKRLSDIASGDASEILELSVDGVLDLEEARKRGLTRLIKKVKIVTVYKEDEVVTTTDLELYPADQAIDKLLKVHGKYQNQELPEGTVIKVTIGQNKNA